MDSALCEKVLSLVPEYGRWDDLFALFGSSLEDQVLKMIRIQLQEDINNYTNNKKVSLLAKWLPSENASSQKTKAFARKIRSYLGYDSKTYRLTLSRLRHHLDVVEIKMCENKWSAINYSKVPSRALCFIARHFLSMIGNDIHSLL